MNLPLLIARRSASHLSPVQRTMKRIASIAITISVAVMIITFAVVAGFREQINKATHFLSADIIITAANRTTSSLPQPINQSDSLFNLIATTADCHTLRPFVLCGAIARSANDVASVIIKGVDGNYPLDHFEELIIDGRTPKRDGTRSREVAIPHTLAEKLDIKTNGRIELLLIGNGTRPERETFKVSGIYKAIGSSLGAPILLTDIRSAQRINGWSDNQISGYEAESSSPERSEEVANQIELRLMYEYEGDESLYVTTTARQFQSIYAWLATHDINAMVIIVIMFAVALFNVITALLTMIAERTRMVGILKSLGMTNAALRKLFLYRTAEIVVLGLVVGDIIGLGLALLQSHTHIVSLNSDAYIIDHVPVAISVGDILLINLIFGIAIIAFTAISTSIIQSIKPAIAVKYE